MTPGGREFAPFLVAVSCGFRQTSHSTSLHPAVSLEPTNGGSVYPGLAGAGFTFNILSKYW